MLIIRIQRKKNKKLLSHTYNIVIIKKTKQINSQKIIIKLGSYNPNNRKITLNVNKFISYLHKGVKMTQRVHWLINKSSKFISHPNEHITKIQFNKN